MAETHLSRIERTRRQFDEAMARFLARLEAVGPSGEEPTGNGWNPAQIAWHVAKVNETFAALMAGTAPGPEPAPAGFVERPWAEVGAAVPAKLTARGAVVPPPQVTMAEALHRLRASADLVRHALAGLTPERGAGYVLRTSITGEISIYQIGEWATAHVIRHNAQAKRVIAEGQPPSP